ncbi:MAG: type II secretion system protein GspL [Steroidobacteraceae bacterium]
MADWLMLRLGRNAAQPMSWAVVDSRGQLLGATETAVTPDLTAIAAGHRVCALVPGADVLQTSADIPVKGSAKLQQVVAYALEEQVAADIDELHFVVGNPGSAGVPIPRTAVDVVANTLMREWLATLASTGVNAEIMYADSELLPLVPGHITALIEGDSIVIRSDLRRPMSLPCADIDAAFELAFGEGASAEEIGMQHLIVYAAPQDWPRYCAQVEALRPRVATLKIQLLSGGVLPLLAQQFGDEGPINLLQGAFAPVRKSSGSLRSWRMAAILAGALIGLHLLGRVIELNQLGKVNAGLDASIEQAFRSAMPGEQSAVDARRRMESRLAALAAGRSEQGGLLPLLSALASARSTAPATRFEAISFRNGSVDMKVLAPDAESLERINQSLRSSGLMADLTSGAARGSNYEGRLQIRMQPAAPPPPKRIAGS